MWAIIIICFTFEAWCRNFCSLGKFFPFQTSRSEISIRVWSPALRFHRYWLFVVKTQFLPFQNESNVSNTVPYNTDLAQEAVCAVPTRPQPFSPPDIQLKCSALLFLVYLMPLPSPTPSFVCLCQVTFTWS